MQSVNSSLCEAFRTGNLSECLELIELFSDYSKRELNRALIIFAGSKWQSVDQYRSTLMRLAPEIRGDVQTVGPTRNLTSLFNLSVVYFHAGHYKTAINLLEKIQASNNQHEAKHLVRPILRLESEIMIQMCQPERALLYINKALKKSEDYDGDPNLSTALDMSRIRAELMLKLQRTQDLFKSTNVKPEHQWHMDICKAHASCLQSDYKTALQYIVHAQCDPYTSSINESTYIAQSPKLIVNNAIGCLYGAMGKPNLALSFFQKSASSFNFKEVSRGLLQVPTNTKACLMHNLGIALLQSGQGQAALDCLLSVLQIYSRNPRLWLRLAECCICEQKNGNAYCMERSRRKDLIQSVIGSGPHRKYLIKTSCSDNVGESVGGSGAIPMATMEFACLCVRNCLALLPSITEYKQDLNTLFQHIQSRSSGRLLVDGLRTFMAPPGAPLSVAEVHRLRCSALCDLSFIYLCMGEVLMASTTASNLLEMPHLSPLHSTLGRLYLAETCILMEKTREAEQLLDPTLVKDLTWPELWNGPIPQSNWFPDSVDNMRAVVCHNLALFYAANANYKRALEVLAQIPECRMPIHGIYLTLYLQLKTGDLAKAKATINNDQTLTLKNK